MAKKIQCDRCGREEEFAASAVNGIKTYELVDASTIEHALRGGLCRDLCESCHRDVAEQFKRKLPRPTP